MRTISAPSHVGLRGRYRLPRGFHARFQWEIGSLTFGGTLPQTMFSPGLGLMSRNSGVFLGGPAGELGFGLWDTPMAQVGNYAPDYGVLVNASMLLSSSILGGMPFANGAVAGQTNADFCVRTPLGFFEPHNADLTHCANQAMNFDRRQANSLIYQSPALAGFALRVQHEVNFRRSSDFLEPRRNPSLWSAHLAFSRAGVYAGLGYERRQDFVADAAQMATGLSLGGLGSSQAQWSAGPTGIAGSIEEGARANLRYSFGFGLTLGVLVEQLSFYARYGAAVAGDILELQKRAGRVEAVFRRGSHTLGGAYHHALRIRGKLAGGNAFNDEASSGFGVTVGYAYAITRKLHGQLYHMSIVNERNARYNVVFQGLPSPPGADLRATGVGFQYAF
jgi:predicted porin